MNEFVVDASVALAWLLPTQSSLLSTSLLQNALRTTVFVPSLWHLEIANQLGLRHRSGKLTTPELQNALDILDKLNVVTDFTVTSAAETIQQMTAFGLTAYDATYLKLAVRTKLPLASFDKKLISAAAASGVTILI